MPKFYVKKTINSTTIDIFQVDTDNETRALDSVKLGSGILKRDRGEVTYAKPIYEIAQSPEDSLRKIRELIVSYYEYMGHDLREKLLGIINETIG